MLNHDDDDGGGTGTSTGGGESPSTATLAAASATAARALKGDELKCNYYPTTECSRVVSSHFKLHIFIC